MDVMAENANMFAKFNDAFSGGVPRPLDDHRGGRTVRTEKPYREVKVRHREVEIRIRVPAEGDMIGIEEVLDMVQGALQASGFSWLGKLHEWNEEVE